jgi:hypothetical protein
MAGKGQKCPECGRQTFYPPHKGTGARTCSQCGAQGWHTTAPPRAAGRGDECNICGNGTYRVVARLNGVTVRYCSICEATALTA